MKQEVEVAHIDIVKDIVVGASLQHGEAGEACEICRADGNTAGEEEEGVLRKD